MCYSVYIGTTEKQEVGKFVPNETDIYFEELSEEKEKGIRPKFKNPFLYYVGSDTNCSCGLVFDSEEFDNPEEQDNKKSPTRLLEFINKRTEIEDLELYCCWDGHWDDPIKDRIELDIRTISLDKNYFGPVLNQFIVFKRKN
ncbi:hypothetical protein ACD591_08085 [Rufibacter glacialis]|uniref:Uncharacterized protein n=1 Tax=Rufibacter glacialis TaxID=1259555 RepID=A0A5M8QTM9_9BACT|nr:hypothetical protein [Rufibacter glacialis]KAA6437976.1 hypothetical protein FOE74_00940 [Rufibacter glacialis]GGK89706.1 hypothetical protein GCM10011405_41760 [Rufibacter glacialis]